MHYANRIKFTDYCELYDTGFYFTVIDGYVSMLA